MSPSGSSAVVPSPTRPTIWSSLPTFSTRPEELGPSLLCGSISVLGWRPVAAHAQRGGRQRESGWPPLEVLRAAYREYLQHDLPMQVSIAVKTALLPARATAPLLDDVTHTIEALIGVGSPPTACIPIGEQPFGNRINELVNGYLSAAYKCIRQASSSSSREGMCWGLGDVLQEVNEAAREEGWRFGIEL
mmetsp:Transcript_27821/g.69449  ORF Transcript_27821/g.69449 Transcript_27821/m.69449 type:complete len:190 (-) Transcript_27821:701-1270(-)